MKVKFTVFFKRRLFSGDYETFVAMALDGYDHITDITDADGSSISKVARSRGHFELATFLDELQEFEVILRITSMKFQNLRFKNFRKIEKNFCTLYDKTTLKPSRKFSLETMPLD